MNYADFFAAPDVAAYRRVKLGSMRLAGIARQAAAVMVDGHVTIDGGRKHYVVTREGRFRLAMAHNSDNGAERREHERLGARYVVMGDPQAMADWFGRHGLDGVQAVRVWRGIVRRQLRESIEP